MKEYSTPQVIEVADDASLVDAVFDHAKTSPDDVVREWDDTPEDFGRIATMTASSSAYIHTESHSAFVVSCSAISKSCVSRWRIAW